MFHSYNQPCYELMNLYPCPATAPSLTITGVLHPTRMPPMWRISYWRRMELLRKRALSQCPHRLLHSATGTTSNANAAAVANFIQAANGIAPHACYAIIITRIPVVLLHH